MKVMGIAVATVVAAISAGYALRPPAGDFLPVATGQAVYAAQCASCHWERLEGQPDWRTRKADGRLPAPPHDETGHTWHHPDSVLFDIVKDGGGAKLATPYETDMPVFGSAQSDAEIWAVLAYIKSGWPDDVRRRQAAVTERAQ